ncbi:cytochrome P450 [Roridomyces roridus]|uniref:Cytochrome P450 n=1 Tax=Roridomyces roridus TaxID=1738132 RepID=A0AAD7BE50_9AGAR|nr:cytochrome P450 [Roridomyces roridus]
MSDLPLTAIFVAALLAWAGVHRLRNNPRYPPGPSGYPLVGNIFKFSPVGPWTKLTEYKEKLKTDILFFHGLGNSILVLNSMEAITDLLDKEGGISSDRPVFTVVGELMGLGQARKLAHTALGPNAVKRYHTIQEDLAVLLCKSMLEKPLDFFGHVRLISSRIVLAITYGLSVDQADNEYITDAEATMDMVGRSTRPGAFLCDLIPVMKYLPSWMPFQQEAKKGREMIESLVTKPYNYALQHMASGEHPSLVQELWDSTSERSLGFQHDLKWMTGSLYGAAGDSNYATILTFMMAMAMYPEKQRLAQAEIDRVVGSERMPSVSDRASLPYVNALIKETMRWHPALPLGIARSTSKDTTYRGFLIPKGTVVLPNVWAIAFDPAQSNADEFVPERFLAEDTAPVDPGLWAFGFGRRICPGKHLAENSVFIIISSLLATLDISLPPNGVVNPEFDKDHLVSYPHDFKCTINARSSTTENLVQIRAQECKV